MTTALTADAPILDIKAHLKGSSKDPDFPVLLANEWDGEHNLEGWLMSEKLDGVRAYWDGAKFISRKGNIFYAPAWFTAGLPKCHLDGELFLGRKRFNECSGIVRKQVPVDREWKQITFVVFDLPNAPGGFEARIAKLNTLNLGQYAVAHKHSKLESMALVEQLLDLVIDQLGGEGLMARRPGSSYDRTRSSCLLKLKRFYDMEATVTGYNDGKGWRTGMTGSMKVRIEKAREFKSATGKVLFSIPAGLEFDVGCRDRAMCLKPPAIGTVITFKFQEVSPKDSKPRFPIFLREHAE
jgi:DNA ligase-1